MTRRRVGPDPMEHGRFPIEPWALVETRYHPDDLGVTETMFAVGNGYLGMRDNPEEGRPVHVHGTYVNGFHETWQIHHAEPAFGFARTGQTIVNAPDTKVMKLYIDDEPLTFGTADLEHYERRLDFREGVLRRHLIWRTPSGKRVRIDSTRMVSMTQRHLAVLTLEVEMLTGDAPVVISSQVLNLQDKRDEYQRPANVPGVSTDPRKAAAFDERVLLPRMKHADERRLMLGFQCANSGMTIAVAADHLLQTDDKHEITARCHDDQAKAVFHIEAIRGSAIRLQKTVSYHTSRGVPVSELADRCDRTLDRAARHGLAHHLADQRAWYDEFWAGAGVDLLGETQDVRAMQQAIRYNLFTLAQATARTDGLGVPAKGVTGSGYEGHYFWDTEVYVVPFLNYTVPEVARNVLHFRSLMLPAARERAREMASGGALYPWRTINGEEASAYYAAGSAQVHINADIAHALAKYVQATGDERFLVREGIDVLIETARMWADLGFWRSNGQRSFHIHGVTGPDEYTTVVNNNLFTNVMARFNLEQACLAVARIRDQDPEEFVKIAGRLRLIDEEVHEWQDCAAGMRIPFDRRLGIHPQDDFFLDREVWDLANTPDESFPLMLHYHPLVLYRFQVLKQADVVLALFLQGDRFTLEEKRADFEYYDPITTGDSTLSAVVQSVMAAEVGYHEAAVHYFHQALYVDLMNLHENTVDGLHIASCGGVWACLVAGFGGMRDHNGILSFDPRLPVSWSGLRFRLRWRSSQIQAELTDTRMVLTMVDGGEPEVPVVVRGTRYAITEGSPVVVELPDQGARLPSHLGDHPLVGGRRADGSTITAEVPQPIQPPDPAVQTGHVPEFAPEGPVPPPHHHEP